MGTSSSTTLTFARLRPHLLPLLALVLATFAVYASSLGHDFLSAWDDSAYVTANEAVRGFSPEHLKLAFSRFYVGNYAPLQIVSYMVDFSLWGMKAAGFIFSNILLHVGSGLLYYWLLVRLLQSRLAALAGAALFLLHPVQVESVAWISQRKNVLAMFCFLLALHFYLNYREDRSMRWYLASLLVFFMALLSKSVAIILPVVLLLYDFCFVSPDKRGRWLAEKLPYLAVTVIAVLLGLYSQSAEMGGGKMGYLGDSPWLHFLTMLPVFVRYLGLVLWPARLSAIYQPPLKFGIDAEVIAAAGLICLLLVLGIWLWHRRRELFFWYALAVAGILPVSHIVPLATFMNDRYLYFPMLGVCGLFGWLAARGGEQGGVLGRIVVAGCFLLLVPLAVIAHARTAVWQNSLALWSDTVRKVPQSKEAWMFLAETIYLDCRNPQGSIGPYLRVLDRDPEYPFVNNSVGTYGETGILLRRHAAAVRQSLAQPDDTAALLVLAEGHAQAGNNEEAAKLYRRILSMDPSSAAARQGLAQLAAKGKAR